MKAVALLRSHVGKQEGILSSELLAWFLNTPVALAKKKLARDLSHPFHPVCFLVVVENGFDLIERFEVYHRRKDLLHLEFPFEGTRKLLDEVCLARAKVLASPLSQKEFGKWCVEQKFSLNMGIAMKMKGLFAVVQQVVHCNDFNGKSYGVA